jgi:hypothetical protein
MLAAYLGSAAVVCLPLALYFKDHPDMLWKRAGQISVFDAPHPGMSIIENTGTTLQMFFFHGDNNWRHNYAGEPQLYWPVAIFFATGIVIAIRSLYRASRRRKDAARLWAPITLGWIGVATIPVVLSNEGLPHALRSLMMTPAVFLVAGAGACALVDLAASKVPQIAFVCGGIVVGVLLVGQADHQYFEAWAKQPGVAKEYLALMEETADDVNRLPNQTPKFVVLPNSKFQVRGVPLTAQPLMYLTGSFTERGQTDHHIRYVTDANATSLGILPNPTKDLCDRVKATFPHAEALYFD